MYPIDPSKWCVLVRLRPVLGDLLQARDAEVDELHGRGIPPSGFFEEDVRRLDVAVNDPGRVAVAHADEELLDPVREPVDRDPPLALEQVGERLPAEALEDEEGLLVFITEPEDLPDVRALDPREHDGLTLEAGPHLGAVPVGRLEHLDGDTPPGRPVGRGKDVRRRPAAERPAQLEVGEVEGLERHADSAYHRNALPPAASLPLRRRAKGARWDALRRQGGCYGSERDQSTFCHLPAFTPRCAPPERDAPPQR